MRAPGHCRHSCYAAACAPAGQNLQQADPQAVSNVLWAAANLGLQLTPQQIQQLVQRFQEVLAQATLQDRGLQQTNPQHVSNLLWAAATLELQLTPQQLKNMLQRFQEVLLQAKPQEVSNTFWACARLRYVPFSCCQHWSSDLSSCRQSWRQPIHKRWPTWPWRVVS
jgi:hypothetical protein